MKRVLLIKLTSLGDLIHALPALSDAKRARPELEFDWVIDENFREIALWHPAVKDIVTTNHRRWREALAHPSTLASISRRSLLPITQLINGKMGHWMNKLISARTRISAPRCGAT